MPTKAPSRNAKSTSSSELEQGSEWMRPTRQHQTSRFASENLLFQRASHGSKYNGKVVKDGNSIHPPHSDVPFEFVKNEDDRFVVRTKTPGSEQWDQKCKGVSKEEELVKYMSKVPSFLQRGEKRQDNVLNFGVLDWGRLEQWTHKRDKVVQEQRQPSIVPPKYGRNEKMVVDEKITKPSSGSCSFSNSSSTAVKTEALAHLSEQLNISHINNSVPKVDFSPIVVPLSGMALASGDLQQPSMVPSKWGLSQDQQQPNMVPPRCGELQTSVNNFVDRKETRKKDAHRRSHSVNIKPSRCKDRYLGHDTSNCNGEVSRTLNNSDGEVLKISQVLEELKLDAHDQSHSGKQEGIVLLLPKDFCGSVSSKAHHRTSLHGKSSESNWGSFSDIFSIDETHSEESFSDIPHSCTLNSAVELENELDMKLDTLIKSQGLDLDMSLNNVTSKVEVEASGSDVLDASKDRNVQRFSDEILGDSSIHRRISSGLARVTRSLSFRESSAQPRFSSTYVTAAKSGPAKPEDHSTIGESQSSNKSSIYGREKVSPFRKLLDPIFKSKAVNQSDEKKDDLIVKPVPIPTNEEEHEPSTTKAVLHFTVKSGLPLFKFVVGRNDEIFASTVKSLSALGKDEMSWLYTFYSVQKIRKHSSSWRRNHQKAKPSKLGYKVVGQMKVSEPYFPSWCVQKYKGSHMVKESVLYDVEVSNADGPTSDLKTGREMAAVVVNMPDGDSFYSDDNLGDCCPDSEQDKMGRVVVILPGGDHSLPHDGVPSSLITRWRNGGSCDCGGWDIGCKLRILNEKWQEHKYQVQCDLYDQGETKQCSPFFSLIPLRDGLFSVEYDVQISSLQAFSISVALINSHTPSYSTDADDQIGLKQELGNAKASMAVKSEVPDKHARHPPLSPVGRV